MSVCAVVLAWDEAGWADWVSWLLSLVDYVVVVGGGARTLAEARGLRGRRGFVFVHEEVRRGKPFAVSVGLRVAYSLGCRYALLTDADLVSIEVGANELQRVLDVLRDPGVAATTGYVHYVSDSPIGAEWAMIAETFFHNQRLQYDKDGHVMLSGYLSILDLIKTCSGGCPWIPSDVVDDAYLTLYLWKRGYKTRYTPWIHVTVRYPATLTDYVMQKRRNLVGTWRAEEHVGLRVRDIVDEANQLSTIALTTMTRKAIILGTIASGLAWLLAKTDMIVGRGASDIWKRVETTKEDTTSSAA